MATKYTISAGIQSVLPVHPAAELFDPMSDAELKVLAEDIVQAKGLRNPIIIYVGEDGAEQLLDGRNRVVALERAGFKLVENGKFNYAAVPHQRVSGVDPYDLAVSLNLHRRHLDGAAKRKFAAKLLVLKPGASDRQVAGMVGISHHTVATVRNELVGRGQIAHVETRTDTKGRKQPANKPPKNGVAPGHEGADRPDEVAPGRHHEKYPSTEADLAEMGFEQVGCGVYERRADEHDQFVVNEKGAGAEHAPEGATSAPTARNDQVARAVAHQNEPKPAKPKSAPSVKDPPKQSASEKALAEIKYGTRIYMPKMTPADRRLALEDMATFAAMGKSTLVLGVPLDLPDIDKLAEPKMPGALIGMALNQLAAKGVDDFVAKISPAHQRALKQHFGESDSANAKAEIATLASESMALLTHPKQHVDIICKKLTRIISLTDPDRKLRSAKPAVRSNAKLNEDALPHALGLDAGESSPSTKH